MPRRTILIVALPLALVAGCESHGLVGTCDCFFDCTPTPACPYPTTTSGADSEPLPATDEGSNPDDGADVTGAPLLDAGGGFVSYGELWCARAEGATYTDPPDAPQPVETTEGAAPEGCQCIPFSSAVHGWIDEHEVGGTVVIEQAALELELGAANALVDLLLATRDSIYDDARLECVELVPVTAVSNTCADPLLFDTDPSTTAFEPRELHRGDDAGEVECFPTPEGIAPACSFTDHVNDIALSQGIHRVPRELFEGFVEEPACLMVEGFGITRDTSGAFVLSGVTSDNALARLGLRNGDHFVAITARGERISLEDPWSAMHAFASLRTETSFLVELRRGSATRVLSYRIMQ